MDARRSTTDREPSKSTTVVDPRTSLALWLRTGRTERGLSLDDVARITKIQLKTLERLEAGTQDGLPAEVFVRGFVRAFARCVGLDEDEALKRYQGCSEPSIPASAAKAAAVVEAMAELAPVTAEAISAAPVAEPEPIPEPPKPNKKRRRGAKRRSKRMATGTPVEAIPVVAAEEEAIPESPTPTPEPEPKATPEVAPDEIPDEPIATATWQPTMPPLPTTPTTNVPWRLARPARMPTSLVPSLVIDDADPESAERTLEERARHEGDAPRRSFLPPILLDREAGSIRQGGLTLAVILLLIAATLTLSYLMRRPSSSGDGVTQADARATVIG